MWLSAVSSCIIYNLYHLTGADTCSLSSWRNTDKIFGLPVSDRWTKANNLTSQASRLWEGWAHIKIQKLLLNHQLEYIEETFLKEVTILRWLKNKRPSSLVINDKKKIIVFLSINESLIAGEEKVSTVGILYILPSHIKKFMSSQMTFNKEIKMPSFSFLYF